MMGKMMIVRCVGSYYCIENVIETLLQKRPGIVKLTERAFRTFLLQFRFPTDAPFARSLNRA